MLETISISIKPKIHMTGPGYEISLKDGENIKSEIVILHFDREVI
jgi:hypothetical protein